MAREGAHEGQDHDVVHDHHREHTNGIQPLPTVDDRARAKIQTLNTDFFPVNILLKPFDELKALAELARSAMLGNEHSVMLFVAKINTLGCFSHASSKGAVPVESFDSLAALETFYFNDEEQQAIEIFYLDELVDILIAATFVGPLAKPLPSVSLGKFFGQLSRAAQWIEVLVKESSSDDEILAQFASFITDLTVENIPDVPPALRPIADRSQKFSSEIERIFAAWMTVNPIALWAELTQVNQQPEIQRGLTICSDKEVVWQQNFDASFSTENLLMVYLPGVTSEVVKRSDGVYSTKVPKWAATGKIWFARQPTEAEDARMKDCLRVWEKKIIPDQWLSTTLEGLLRVGMPYFPHKMKFPDSYLVITNPPEIRAHMKVFTPPLTALPKVRKVDQPAVQSAPKPEVITPTLARPVHVAVFWKVESTSEEVQVHILNGSKVVASNLPREGEHLVTLFEDQFDHSQLTINAIPHGGEPVNGNIEFNGEVEVLPVPQEGDLKEPAEPKLPDDVLKEFEEPKPIVESRHVVRMTYSFKQKNHSDMVVPIGPIDGWRDGNWNAKRQTINVSFEPALQRSATFIISSSDPNRVSVKAARVTVKGWYDDWLKKWYHKPLLPGLDRQRIADKLGVDIVTKEQPFQLPTKSFATFDIDVKAPGEPGEKPVVITVTAGLQKVGEPKFKDPVVGKAQVTHQSFTFPEGNKINIFVEPIGGRWRLLGAPTADPLDAAQIDVLAVHAGLLPNDDILLFTPSTRPGWVGRTINNLGFMETGLFNPMKDHSASTVFVTDEAPMKPLRNLFCAGHVHLPDGRLLIAGGHTISPLNWLGWFNGQRGEQNKNQDKRVYLYDQRRNQWRERSSMKHGRWYPTLTVMSDGKVLIASGSPGALLPVPEGNYFKKLGYANKAGQEGIYPAGYDDTLVNFNPHYRAELEYCFFDPEGEEIVYPPHKHKKFTDDKQLTTYPLSFALPAGKGAPAGGLLSIDRERSHLFRYHPESGGVQAHITLQKTYFLENGSMRTFPVYGSAALLTVGFGCSKAYVFVAGGGNARFKGMRKNSLSTKTAEIFEYDPSASLDQQAGWRSLPDMKHNRFMSDVTILPDGAVLVSGGAKLGYSNGNSVPVRRSEIFSPKHQQAGGSFREVAEQARECRYHSTALLLRDATVVSMGSTGGFPPEAVANDFRVEVFDPPYLWRGRRVTLKNVPQSVFYGEIFTIYFTLSKKPDLAQIVLMHLGSVTHANNMGQRRVNLEVVSTAAFESTRDGETFIDGAKVRAPENGTIAPPGPHTLFFVNNRQVPSVGKTLILSDLSRHRPVSKL